jgi:hypothetical protein
MSKSIKKSLKKKKKKNPEKTRNRCRTYRFPGRSTLRCKKYVNFSKKTYIINQNHIFSKNYSEVISG